MPELPEVETVVRGLRERIVGRRIRELQVYDERLVVPGRDAICGRRVRSLDRIGKHVVLELVRGTRASPCWLAYHLRMTGRLLWYTSTEQPPSRALRSCLLFDKSSLLFYDVRRFGEIRLTWQRDSLETGGIDPLQDSLTQAVLSTLLEKAGQELKVWLLRQDRLVGLGNIYACEILFRSRLSPFRKAGSLNVKEIKRLRDAIVDVLQEAVECGGTTLSDYVDSWGNRGNFQSKLQVYGHQKKPCSQCGDTLLRTVQQGRSTFYCPTCQS